MEINKKMQIFEFITQYSIYLMNLKIQNKANTNQTNEQILNAITKKDKIVNSFLTIMTLKISFKKWLKVTRATMAGKQFEQIQESSKKSRIKVEIEVENFYEETTDDEETQI